MNKQQEHDLKIRAAMERLLAGNPLHTDGRLHVKNLADEAGVKRQTVYRSPVLKEFNEHVERISQHGEGPREQHLVRIQKLQEQLAAEKIKAQKYRSERDEARLRESALANQIIVLDKKNQRLTYELGEK